MLFPLAEYALRLALDASERAKFRASSEAGRTAMTAAGLSAAQQQAMLSRDQDRISEAIAAELGSQSGAEASLIAVRRCIMGFAASLRRATARVDPTRTASLSVVGTGIRAASQTSPEAIFFIERADKVHVLVGDPLAQYWLSLLNANIESLHDLFAQGKDRSVTYEQIVERVLSDVRGGLDVCIVTFGHPGVFSYPTHEAIRRARAEGYRATMLPGVSAEDCLFADLGVDPGAVGCQTYDATDFLIHRRNVDTCSVLVLWQVGALAHPGFENQATVWNREGLRVLADVLIERYGAMHEVVIYEAPRYDFCDARVQRVPLGQVADAPVRVASTLYVPPKDTAALDPVMLRRLGPRQR